MAVQERGDLHDFPPAPGLHGLVVKTLPLLPQLLHVKTGTGLSLGLLTRGVRSPPAPNLLCLPSWLSVKGRQQPPGRGSLNLPLLQYGAPRQGTAGLLPDVSHGLPLAGRHHLEFIGQIQE